MTKNSLEVVVVLGDLVVEVVAILADLLEGEEETSPLFMLQFTQRLPIGDLKSNGAQEALIVVPASNNSPTVLKLLEIAEDFGDVTDELWLVVLLAELLGRVEDGD